MEVAERNRFVYEFGRFLLDPNQKVLFADGKRLHLPAKEFATLLLLVEHSGQALSKDELMSAVWQDTFVGEGNLAKQISSLRKILNTNGDQLIETIPKHGYRFSADVRRVLDSPAEIILERRTVSTMTVEREVEDALPPLLPLPPRSRRRWWPLVLAGSILIVSTMVFGFWIWGKQQVIAKPIDEGVVFLTDGQFDDTGQRLTNQGKIYFARRVTGSRVESWVMNADGSDQRRANTEIKDLLNGVWSPDGTKVVFRIEGDDKNLYLADANGENRITLPFAGGNMDWSPDSTRFVHQESTKTKKGVFLYSLETGEDKKLIDDVSAVDPSFSYDGKQIAFVSYRDQNTEVYVMNADGSNIRRITNHPAFDNYPVFSPDGTAIAFQSNRENERTEIYLQNLNNDSPPRKISSFAAETGMGPKSWSDDGTEMFLWTEKNGKAQISRVKVDPYPATIVLSEGGGLRMPRLSPDGRLMLYQEHQQDGSIAVRFVDLGTKETRTIYKSSPGTPPDYVLSPAWSRDGGKVVFSDNAGGNSDIFVIDADGSNLRKLTDDPLPDRNPVFSAKDGEIIFDRHYYGIARLFRMNVDGTDQRLLTNAEGYELTAAISPDGDSLAFGGDRVTAGSRGLDIRIIDLRDPAREVQLTAMRFHETSPTFSPDGKRIAFTSNADGNHEIYVMNMDGSGMLRLTRTKTDELYPEFSKNGRRILYASNREGKFSIYETELP